MTPEPADKCSLPSRLRREAALQCALGFPAGGTRLVSRARERDGDQGMRGGERYLRSTFWEGLYIMRIPPFLRVGAGGFSGSRVADQSSELQFFFFVD